MHVFRNKDYLYSALMLLVPGLHAIADNEATIARCAKIASVGDRILCLEDALRRASGEHGDSVHTEPVEETSAPDALLVTKEAVHEPNMVSEVRGSEADAAPGALTSATVAESVTDAARSAEKSDIGAEQVRARNMTQEEIIANARIAKGMQVAAYAEVPYRRLLVTLDNGQVWRQIKGDTQRIRVDLRRNQTVDISESSLGGYKLRLNEMRRTIRVERVK